MELLRRRGAAGHDHGPVPSAQSTTGFSDPTIEQDPFSIGWSGDVPDIGAGQRLHFDWSATSGFGQVFVTTGELTIWRDGTRGFDQQFDLTVGEGPNENSFFTMPEAIPAGPLTIQVSTPYHRRRYRPLLTTPCKCGVHTSGYAAPGTTRAPVVHLPFADWTSARASVSRLPCGQEDQMNSTLTWEPPAPGPWLQDSAHNPVAQTPLMQQLYPDGFNRGFEEAFSLYGVLLDRLAMATVNGFTYHQPQPFDLPGPDGPKDPEWIGAEFGRRVEVAAQALESRIWREAMRRWDDELKPGSVARHRALDVDVSSLDDRALRSHIDACIAEVTEMVYQHHRHNTHALIPVGDFLLQAATWTGRPPASLLSVFDGYSPVSNVVQPEMRPALEALRKDDEARALLFSDGDAAGVLARLRERVPEVGDYLDTVHFRLLEGFDIGNPTIGERPEALVGRLQTALDVDVDESLQRSDALAAELRAAVPEQHRAAFDDLLAEARLVYRLRDERGLYSEIAAIGLLRLALLELGRRLQDRGRLDSATDVLEATVDEVSALFEGADAPTAKDLRERAIDRTDRTLAGAPRHLGPPPPDPPPVDMLPPPLARVMSAVGFVIDGVLGQKEAPEGDATTIVGIPGAQGVVEGPVRLVRSVDDLFLLEPGDVLVAPTTGEAFNSMLHLVSAIVTDHGSFASHAAIVSREMGIPAVVGTCDGTKRLELAKRVRVDGTSGQVTILE